MKVSRPTTTQQYLGCIGQARVELTLTGLKSVVLPLNYCPKKNYKIVIPTIKAGISKR